MSSGAFPRPRPLAVFFGQFPRFTYDPQSPASEEYNRLRSSGTRVWGAVYDGDKDALWNAYRDALTLEFNARYGTDANDLSAWQTLCARIGLDPVPESLEECRERVMNTHINLVDLVHVHETSQTVKRYDSVYELSSYTIRTGRYFPRENAHAGNLLKYLLRFIMDPAKNNQNWSRGKGRKGGKKRRDGREGAT